MRKSGIMSPAKPEVSQRGSFPPARPTKASASRAAFILAEVKNKAPAILELPEEVLCRIMSFLPNLQDVLACGQACKEWLKALRSDVLWQGQYARTWGSEEAARAADSILVAAESHRTNTQLQNSSPLPSPSPRTSQTSRSRSSDLPAAKSLDTGPRSPARPLSAAASVSGLTRGVGRLNLSPGSRRRAKEKQKVEEALGDGPCVWRDAFAVRFTAEKKTFLASEIKFAESLALLKRRRGQQNQGGRVLDPVPGMARLLERLLLRFELRINNGRAVPLGGRSAYQSFPTSLSLKCPPSALSQGLTVQKLLKIEVTAISERLYSTTKLIHLDAAALRRGAFLVGEKPPLSLYECSLYPNSAAEGGSLVIGTFASGGSVAGAMPPPARKSSVSDRPGLSGGEPFASDRRRSDPWDTGVASTSKDDTSGVAPGIYTGLERARVPAGDEEVVLLVFNVPVVDVLWKVMALGPGYGPREHHRVVPHDTDSQYGLHGYHASAQIRSFGKLLWCHDFYRCFHSRRESVPGEKAVFVFVPNEGGAPVHFQGVPKLAWRTEAFSGELPGALVLDFVLWDQNDEIAWHCSKVVSTRPLPSPPSPEFGLPCLDGECSRAVIEDVPRGVSLTLDLRVALKDPNKRAGEDILPQSAVTGLRLCLKSRFLADWFGTSRI